MFKFTCRDQDKGLMCRSLVKAPLQEGGINAPDIEIMFKSYSLTWLRKIANFKEFDRGWYKILNILLLETTLNISLTDIWKLKSGQFLDLQTQIKGNFWNQIFGLIPELIKSVIYTRLYTGLHIHYDILEMYLDNDTFLSGAEITRLYRMSDRMPSLNYANPIS